MTHKHNAKQTSRAIIHKMRSALIGQLAELLWDQTKPNGEEAVPEDQWEAILTGPCNGDTVLMAEVCEFERNLRTSMESHDEPVVHEVTVPASMYLYFVFGFFKVRSYPLHLLWNIEK